MLLLVALHKCSGQSVCRHVTPCGYISVVQLRRDLFIQHPAHNISLSLSAVSTAASKGGNSTAPPSWLRSPPALYVGVCPDVIARTADVMVPRLESQL
jgi:hypothetical protein